MTRRTISKRIPSLTIILCGPAKYPRCVVAKADDLRNPIYWTGSDWIRDESAALVFFDINAALWVYRMPLVENVSQVV